MEGGLLFRIPPTPLSNSRPHHTLDTAGRTDGRAGRPAEVNPFPVANLHNCPIYLSIGREGLNVGANPYVHAKDTRMGTLRDRGRVVTLFWGPGLRS